MSFEGLRKALGEDWKQINAAYQTHPCGLSLLKILNGSKEKVVVTIDGSGHDFDFGENRWVHYGWGTRFVSFKAAQRAVEDYYKKHGHYPRLEENQ